jgi:hypothetical protein
MQPKLYPKWGTMHTKKVHEYEKKQKIATEKATDLGTFVMWLHEHS